MEIIEIKTVNELPLGTRLVMYGEPYSSTNIIEDATQQFIGKYGKEPEVVWKYGNVLFLKGE
jgi:short subunit fatty acids transporter